MFDELRPGIFLTRARRSFCAVALVSALGCRSKQAPPAPPPEDRHLAEFSGAYPNEVRASGVVREVDLTAAEATLPLVDGTSMRVWAYNGSVPGPTIRVRLGDTLRVRFHNKLPAPTTIHWHGVRVPNAMDGVAPVTQAAVAPGESFVYEFTPKDAGTFWFHPHIRSAEQVERGLYGVLVVEDPEPAPFSADVVWVLDDWLRDESGQLIERFVTPHDLAHDGRWGNAITVNGRTNEQLRVGSGDRIRIRLVNSANGRVFRPDFHGLNANVIAVDGLYVREPFAAGALEIAPGNRVDIDISIAGWTQSRVEIVDRFIASSPNRLAEIIVAKESPPAPMFASPAHARVPRWLDAIGVPTHHVFTLDARRGGPHGIEWTIDGVAMSEDHAEHRPLTTLDRGKFHHLRFTNASARLHPIHFHGMFFRLLARNGVPTDEPFFRDTVLVHGRETIDIGVVPMDAGRWMMHCHILEHAAAGMMTMIDVR